MIIMVKKLGLKIIAIKRWKYSYNYKQTYTNESNFGIKLFIRSWYTIK